MQIDPLPRRSFLKGSTLLLTPMMLAADISLLQAAEPRPGRTLKVVCVGGHPDDPESGCAGTLARYAELGHSVTVIYLTRGERGIRDKSLDFFEVNSGSQTQGFLPNTYVDISSAVEKKKSALPAHVSQDGQGIWRQHHEPIATWRGREAGVAAAEAFVHLNRDQQTSPLPGI